METTLQRATRKALAEEPDGDFPTDMFGEPIILGTATDVDERYAIPPRRSRDLCRENKMPHIRLGGRIYFNMARIERWLRNGGNGGSP